VTSALTGETEPLARRLLALLFSVPQRRWQERDDSPALRYLCRRGLLVSDDDAFEVLRDRDAQLADLGWLPTAAVYHFSILSRGDRAGEVDYDLLVRQLGPPPPTFPAARDGSRTPLPNAAPSGGLYEALERRRTGRTFDRSRPLSSEQVVVLLSEAFRARSRVRLHDELEVLHKSSPSAGALHPVEAYPIVRNVEGLEPGLYHYAASDHALERLGDETDDDVTDFTAGQEFASAPLVLVLAVRFRRSYWKYRKHPTAYATLLMDAAHLSQTLYLIAADLGLAAFFTNRVNAGDIDDRLGLDGIEEGALAVWGCGYPAS
jgi:putative peptide maturation dehydrogenase